MNTAQQSPWRVSMVMEDRKHMVIKTRRSMILSSDFYSASWIKWQEQQVNYKNTCSFYTNFNFFTLLSVEMRIHRNTKMTMRLQILQTD
jgi:hypothetical protein